MATSISRRDGLLLAGAALAAGALPRLALADTLDDIKQAGTIKIGVGVMGTKPWVYQNADGSYAGMEYEMLQYILPKLGISKFEYVTTEWDSLIPGLKAKRWDIIFSGMTVTEERRQGAGIEFTRPYYFESDRIAVKEDSPYQKPEDLKGKILATTVGTVEEIQAKSLVAKGMGGEVKSFDDFAAPFLALQNGQVDAVIVDNTTYGEQKVVTPNIRTIGEPMSLSASPEWQAKQDAAGYKYGGDGIGVRKEDTALLAALNKALDDMDADGVRQKIMEKYGVWDQSLTRESMMGK
ncbi:MAG TPA: transporter substrate-binding domain-containing protein [Dongiaceae bacterium]|jgi:ABC-type amino acid transport substrate-binding protein|nr:transporter substrate-binding domain-containing protein [Dongiaceae bacterium]